jgi:hypothetical protein
LLFARLEFIGFIWAFVLAVADINVGSLVLDDELRPVMGQVQDVHKHSIVDTLLCHSEHQRLLLGKSVLQEDSARLC